MQQTYMQQFLNFIADNPVSFVVIVLLLATISAVLLAHLYARTQFKRLERLHQAYIRQQSPVEYL